MDKNNSNLEPLFNHLAKLHIWLDSPPSIFTTFTNPHEVMKEFMEILSWTNYLLKACVASSPENKHDRGYVRNQAIIVGHMVRMYKLYDGFCIHVAERQLELAGIFMRLLLECEVKINYLMSAKQKAFHSYVLVTHRANKEMLKDLKKKGKERKLLPIEKRILNGIRRELKEDGITQKELLNNKNWDIDGKSIRSMLKEMDREGEYSYGFGSSSRWIHGNWTELKKYHLSKNGRYYIPELHYGDVDINIAAPITYFTLRTAYRYLEWNKSDPDRIVSELVEGLGELVFKIDSKAESML